MGKNYKISKYPNKIHKLQKYTIKNMKFCLLEVGEPSIKFESKQRC